jgi:hypothetical protein
MLSMFLPLEKEREKEGAHEIRRREERRRPNEEAPNFLKNSDHVPGETPHVLQETPHDPQGTPHEPQAGCQVSQGEDRD